MANTYSQIYVQVIFAVKGRHSLLNKSWRADVFKYISGIIKKKGQKPIIVNGASDHVHVFIGLKPSVAVSDLVRDIKNNSSNYINENFYQGHKFSWQDGFGVFSYSHSQIDQVYKYIENQEEHHRKKTFKEEYIDFLEKFKISYDNKYIFEWIE